MEFAGYHETRYRRKIAQYQTPQESHMCPGMVLLFLHGFGSSSSLNMDFYLGIHSMVQNRQNEVVHSYAIDLVGHGLSDGPHRLTTNAKEHLDCIHQTQDRIMERYAPFEKSTMRFVVVGHSMGGILALGAVPERPIWECVAVAPCFCVNQAGPLYLGWVPGLCFRFLDSLLRFFPLQHLRLDSGITPRRLYTVGTDRQARALYCQKAEAWLGVTGGHIGISPVDIFTLAIMGKMLSALSTGKPGQSRILVLQSDDIVDNSVTQRWAASNSVPCKVMEGMHEDIILYTDVRDCPLYESITEMIVSRVSKRE